MYHLAILDFPITICQNITSPNISSHHSRFLITTMHQFSQTQITIPFSTLMIPSTTNQFQHEPSMHTMCHFDALIETPKRKLISSPTT